MSDIVNIDQTIEEPLTKPKKPRTTKQLEAFEKVKEKRKQNIETKKQVTYCISTLFCNFL